MHVLFRSEFPTRSGSRFRHIDFDCRRSTGAKRKPSFRKRVLILEHLLEHRLFFPILLPVQKMFALIRQTLHPMKIYFRRVYFRADVGHKKTRAATGRRSTATAPMMIIEENPRRMILLAYHARTLCCHNACSPRPQHPHILKFVGMLFRSLLAATKLSIPPRTQLPW